MSVFSDIAAKVEAFAEAAIAEGEKELDAIIKEVESGAADALEAAEPVAERALLALVDALGATASALVYSLFGKAGVDLSGTSKANLAATSLIDAAFARGIKLVDSDASVLVKNAFTAVEDKLRQAAAS